MTSKADRALHFNPLAIREVAINDRRLSGTEFGQLEFRFGSTTKLYPSSHISDYPLNTPQSAKLT